MTEMQLKDGVQAALRILGAVAYVDTVVTERSEVIMTYVHRSADVEKVAMELAHFIAEAHRGTQITVNIVTNAWVEVLVENIKVTLIDGRTQPDRIGQKIFEAGPVFGMINIFWARDLNKR